MRGRISVAVAVAVVLVAGCHGGGDSSKPIPADTVAKVSKDIYLPSLHGQALTETGSFTSHDAHFTLVASSGGRLQVSKGDLKHVADFVDRLHDDDYTHDFKVGVNGHYIDASFKAKRRSKDLKRWIVAAGPDLMQRLVDDREGAHSSAFTKVGDHYVVSFVSSDIPDDSLLGFKVPPAVAAAYVEVCQNVIGVSLSSRTSLKARVNPHYGRDDVALAGQETLCNMLGVAAALARAGVSFKDYDAHLKRVNGKFFNTPYHKGTLNLPFLGMDEEIYKDLAKDLAG